MQLTKRTLVFGMVMSALAGANAAEAQCQVQKLTASDAAEGDNFGRSVSISGDVAVVGAWFRDDAGSNSGVGYVYRFDDQTSQWEELAKLSASDAAPNDEFGVSVSISGDVVIIGAYFDDDAGGNSGSAYVFEKPVGGWVDTTETAKLTGSDAAGFDHFGFSVSVDGDVAVVGAPDDDDGGEDSGSAYIFQKPVGGWVNATQTAKLTASDAAASDQFGVSVSISGDAIVVGSHQTDNSGPGSAYVFEKPVGAWVNATETGKLAASDAEASDAFGNSVSISGDVVLVGASFDDDACPGNPNCDSGSAYVFQEPVGGWVNATETAKLTASDAAASDQFGVSVSINGDTIVVGSHQTDNSGSGSAYVFEKPVGAWVNATETAKLTASDAEASDAFGNSVSISGNVALVGATFDDDACPGNPNCDSGSAYVFTVDQDCPAIPAVSEWGLIVMSLLVLTAGTLVYARRRPVHT